MDTRYKLKQFNTNNLMSSIAFTVLCLYLADVSLTYIDWMPSVNSLLFKGFIVIAAITVMSQGKVVINTHIKIYGFFAFVCLLSCIYSSTRTESFASTITVIKVLVFLVMICNIITTKERMERAFFMFCISNVILFFYLISANLLANDLRLGGSLTGNANTFARIYMIGAFWSVYLVFFSDKKIIKVFSILFFILQEYAIVLAGSKKNLLAPLILLIVVFSIRVDKKARRKIFLYLLLAVAGCVALYWAFINVPILYDSIGYRFESLLSVFSGEGIVDVSTRNRLAMMKSGLELWLQSPILGHGIDSFKVVSSFGVYSHNNFIELLSGVGVIGFAIYYSYFVYILKKMSSLEIGTKWFWVGLILSMLFFEIGGISYRLFDLQMVYSMPVIAWRIEQINNIANRDLV